MICTDIRCFRRNRLNRGNHVRFTQSKDRRRTARKSEACSDAAGYESIDEFVIHMLEKETNKIIPPDESNTSKEDIQKRLRGLGYIE